MKNNTQDFKNISEYYEGLSFEEERHLYFVGEATLPSVSGLIKNYSTTFNEKYVSEKVSNRTGEPVENILKNWKEIKDEACNRGTRVHNFGEAYAFDRTLIPSCPQEKAVKKFWDEMPEHIIPVFVELKMYHKIFMYAGTGDIILYDTINKYYIIADYKTNKDLFKNYNKETLKYPFTNMLSTPFSKYTLQLSYYQLLFEQTGFKIGARKLIYLNLQGEYKMYDLPNVTEVLKQELLKRN